MHWYFICMTVWECWILWNWSYRLLWSDMWVLGIEPRYSGRSASALNLRAIALASTWFSLSQTVLTKSREKMPFKKISIAPIHFTADWKFQEGKMALFHRSIFPSDSSYRSSSTTQSIWSSTCKSQQQKGSLSRESVLLGKKEFKPEYIKWCCYWCMVHRGPGWRRVTRLRKRSCDG